MMVNWGKLINYTVEFLKNDCVCHILWISKIHSKSDEHGHRYKFLPRGMIVGGYWLRVDFCNIGSETNLLSYLILHLSTWIKLATLEIGLGRHFSVNYGYRGSLSSYDVF
jgi:hypothetical protein